MCVASTCLSIGYLMDIVCKGLAQILGLPLFYETIMLLTFHSRPNDVTLSATRVECTVSNVPTNSTFPNVVEQSTSILSSFLPQEIMILDVILFSGKSYNAF